MSWRSWPPSSRSPLGGDDLVLAGYTVDAADLLERVAAARVNGYRAISLRSSDLRRAKEDGWTLPALQQLLDDNGVLLNDLDGYTAWSVTDQTCAHRTRADLIWEAAAELKARSITIADLDPRAKPLEELVAGFVECCDQAAEFGLLVTLEPLGPFAVPNYTVAADIVRRANRPNGGLLFDIWHHFRAGGRPEDVDDIADLIMSVQINDAPATAHPDWSTETMHHRLLPGHGDAQVSATLARLAQLGVDVPITVEVMSDQLRQMSAEQAAGVAMAAAREVLPQRPQQRDADSGHEGQQ